MISITGVETTRVTALRLLKKATGDEDAAADKSAGPSDPFDQLFSPDLGPSDGTDEADGADDTYQPVPPKVKPPTFTTASGKVVEGLVDGGGDTTDSLGNPIPVAYHITWNGLEVARIFKSGSVSASSSFDYSSIFANDPPENQNLFGADLVKTRLAQFLDFFSHQ